MDVSDEGERRRELSLPFGLERGPWANFGTGGGLSEGVKHEGSLLQK